MLDKNIKNIHFIGICGTAMGTLAILLQKRGFCITGSDDEFYDPIKSLLEREKIKTHTGFDAKNIQNPDLVVVGNAISRGHDNPELEKTLTDKIPYISMAELLHEFFIRGRESLVVTGTHGKTTTTSLLAHVFHSAGHNPGFFIGGVPENFGTSCADGEKYFITEGDEYDTAFFDKRSKFLHYAPDQLIINNIEFDHADIFDHIGDIIRSFALLLRTVPKNGIILANGDDPNVREVLTHAFSPIKTFGFGENCDIRAQNIKHDGDGMKFEVTDKTRGHDPLCEGDEPEINAFFATWVTHDSRTSERMTEYSVKKGKAVHFDKDEEIEIAKIIKKIAKEDNLQILALNICIDHIHAIILCTGEEKLQKIIQKIKSITARHINIKRGITTPADLQTMSHDPLSRREENHSKSLWAQKFNRRLLETDRDIAETINYTRENRTKHGIPENKELEKIISEIITDEEHAWDCENHKIDNHHFKIPLSGEHNVCNALAVIAIARHNKITDENIQKAFDTFKSVKRRLELKGKPRGAILYDDFAHHPTAVRETLRALRAKHPGQKIVAIFEPRSNTSVQNIYEREFIEHLAIADEIILTRPHRENQIPVEKRINIDRVASEIRARDREAFIFDNPADIVEHLIARTKAGDVIVVMSNGSFSGKIHEILLKRL